MTRNACTIALGHRGAGHCSPAARRAAGAAIATRRRAAGAGRPLPAPLRAAVDGPAVRRRHDGAVPVPRPALRRRRCLRAQPARRRRDPAGAPRCAATRWSSAGARCGSGWAMRSAPISLIPAFAVATTPSTGRSAPARRSSTRRTSSRSTTSSTCRTSSSCTRCSRSDAIAPRQGRVRAATGEHGLVQALHARRRPGARVPAPGLPRARGRRRPLAARALECAGVDGAVGRRRRQRQADGAGHRCAAGALLHARKRRPHALLLLRIAFPRAMRQPWPRALPRQGVAALKVPFEQRGQAGGRGRRPAHGRRADLLALKPVLLPGDAAAVRARRLLQRADPAGRRRDGPTSTFDP